MSAADVFFDTDILLYVLSADEAKADRAEALIASGGVISVQVLNEFVSVASRKFAMRAPEIREVLSVFRSICAVEPLTIDTHDLALDLMERFQLSFYDALIVAAALLAKCNTLYSEDMHHDQKIESLRIKNPFRDL
jgi:predicted nucleic acid-binding protein